MHARFAEADLASILDHHTTSTAGGPTHSAGEDHSLTQGTKRWATLGKTTEYDPGAAPATAHETTR